MGTTINGRPAASACARSTSALTACMATRFADSLTVVSRPAGSPSPSLRSTWSIHALSLPLLHETRIFIRRYVELLPCLWMQRASNELDRLRDPGTWNDGALVGEQVHAARPDRRHRGETLPDGNLTLPRLGGNGISA